MPHPYSPNGRWVLLCPSVSSVVKIFVGKSANAEGTLLSRELFQPPPRLIQCLRLFAEGETHLLRPILRMFVETRSWHASDADFFYQISRKLHVIRESKSADVGHHVISPPRTVASNPAFLECRNQMIAPCAIPVREFAIVTCRQAQRCRSRFL